MFVAPQKKISCTRFVKWIFSLIEEQWITISRELPLKNAQLVKTNEVFSTNFFNGIISEDFKDSYLHLRIDKLKTKPFTTVIKFLSSFLLNLSKPKHLRYYKILTKLLDFNIYIWTGKRCKKLFSKYRFANLISIKLFQRIFKIR